MAKTKQQISSVQAGTNAIVVLLLLMASHYVVANFTEELSDPNNLITYVLGAGVVIYLAIRAVDYFFKLQAK